MTIDERIATIDRSLADCDRSEAAAKAALAELDKQRVALVTGSLPYVDTWVQRHGRRELEQLDRAGLETRRREVLMAIDDSQLRRAHLHEQRAALAAELPQHQEWHRAWAAAEMGRVEAARKFDSALVALAKHLEVFLTASAKCRSLAERLGGQADFYSAGKPEATASAILHHRLAGMLPGMDRDYSSRRGKGLADIRPTMPPAPGKTAQAGD